LRVGCWSGTRAGNTTHRESSRSSRGSNPARIREDLPLPDHGNETTRPALQSRLQQLQQPRDFMIAAKEHGGIIAGEGLQSRVR
jgi:hypothetical protein